MRTHKSFREAFDDWRHRWRVSGDAAMIYTGNDGIDPAHKWTVGTKQEIGELTAEPLMQVTGHALEVGGIHPNNVKLIAEKTR